MRAERKIAIVVNHVHINDEDEKDIEFWLSKTPTERLAEVCRLRHNYFSSLDGSFPEKIVMVAFQRHIDSEAKHEK